jgi:Mn2+/Fe2+ NRAMP family transporter
MSPAKSSATAATPNWWQRLGPGLLFAGSAIGVSHVFQSTRAGAEYGLGLLSAVILANVLKYPFFEFGPRYAMATGESLLAGYKRLGYWILVLYLILTLVTVFTIQAAVTSVTAALVQHVLGTHILPWIASGILLGLCSIILLAGRYQALDRSMKMIVVAMSITTLVALAAAYLGAPHLSNPIGKTFHFSDPLAIVFLIGLMGWMPAPIDLSVWHSIWALEKRHVQPNFRLKEALFDFRIGYIGTGILAVAFLLLGARMLYGTTPDFPSSASAFSALLIDMYRNSLGSWAGWIISFAALATMFSTTITVFDAMPRVIRQAILLLGEGPGTAPRHSSLEEKKISPLYAIILGVILLGALVVIRYFAADLRSLVDMATLLSFLTAPFFALANYALVTGRHTPDDAKPGKALRLLSWLGMFYLAGFSVYYLIIR